MAKKNQPKRRPNPPAKRQEPRPQSQSTGAARPNPAPQRAQPAPRRREAQVNVFTQASKDMLFDRRNLIIMGAGLALVALGLILMAGGHQPDPNVWDPNLPYSFTRITLAPMLMVAGFVVAVWGIFAQPKTGKVLAEENIEPTE